MQILNYYKVFHINKNLLRTFGLIVSIILKSVLEVIGIGLFIPILTYFTDSSGNSKIVFLLQKYFSNNYINFNDQNIIILFLFILIFFYLIKFLLSILFEKIRLNTIRFFHQNLVFKIIKYYIYRDYSESSIYSSAEIIRNIRFEVADLVHRGLSSIIQIFSNLFFLICIIIFLLFIDYKVTLFILLLFCICIFFYVNFFKKILTNIGITKSKSSVQNLSNLNAIINGTKEANFLRLEKSLFIKFKNTFKDLEKVKVKDQLILQLPILFLEIVSIIILSSIIMYFISNEMKSGAIIANLGIFVICIIKIVPSLTKIVSYYQGVRYAESSLEIIKKIFARKYFNNKSKEKVYLSFKKKLSFKNIKFKFKQGIDFTFQDFEITKGQVIGIFGNSGVGKTTLLEMIIGLNKPNQGVIKFDRNLVNYKKINSILNCSYVPQKIFLFEDNIKDNILCQSSENKQLFKNAIKLAELDRIYTKYTDRKKIGENGVKLSGGQRQRIGIARAVYSNKDFIVMDEATNSLDEKSEYKIFKKLYMMNKYNNNTIIFVSHNKKLSKFCHVSFNLTSKEINKNLRKVYIKKVLNKK